MWQESVVYGFPASPQSIQIAHLRGRGPYEALMKWSCQTILSKAWSWRGVIFQRSPRWLAWHQTSSGSMSPEDAADRSMSQPHVTSNSTFPHALGGKCKHFMPTTYRGWTGHKESNQWELRENMQFFIGTFHSAKADSGKWPHKLWFGTSTIPLGIEMKVRQI